jgi:tellurite methyltransferase
LSEADRQKWNARYAQGAFETRTYPNELLEQWLPEVPVGRALDVACGAGRNSLFMAAAGFVVDAIDISSAGLTRAALSTAAQGLEVNWIEHDLETALPPLDSYDLIVMFRYVNMPLLAGLKNQLRPGGYLLVEEHLQTDAEVAGPRGTRFRVAPGVLVEAAGDLEICHCEEALVGDPDGRRVALARLVARRD